MGNGNSGVVTDGRAGGVVGDVCVYTLSPAHGSLRTPANDVKHATPKRALPCAFQLALPLGVALLRPPMLGADIASRRARVFECK